MKLLGYISGPSEGVLISCFVLLISTFYGPGFWSRKLDSFFNQEFLNFATIVYPDFKSMMLKHFAFWIIVFLVVFTQLPISLYRVYTVCKVKKVNFFKAISGLFPFLGLCIFAELWITSPNDSILKEYTIPLYIGLGFVFAKLTVIPSV